MKTAQRFWFLALTTPLIYLLICAAINRWVFAKRAVGGFWPLSDQLYLQVFAILASLAIVALPAVFLLKTRWALRAPDLLDKTAKPREPAEAGESRKEVGEEDFPLFGNPRGRRFVCLFMICDTIAFLGLVLFLIQGRLRAMLVFGVLALIGYAMSYPGGATASRDR